MKIFCLPYAGGTSEIIYSTWSIQGTDFIPMKIPGRGSTISDEKILNIDELLNFHYFNIKKNVQLGEKYIIFGHSFGALVGFLLVLLIEEKKEISPPEILIVASKNSPEVFDKSNYKLVNFEEFLDYLNKNGKNYIKDEEYLSYLMRCLNDDYSIMMNIENYRLNKKINSNLVYIYGRTDELIRKKNYWYNYTNGNYEEYDFSGNHYFIESNSGKVLKLIKNLIANIGE